MAITCPGSSRQRGGTQLGLAHRAIAVGLEEALDSPPRGPLGEIGRAVDPPGEQQLERRRVAARLLGHTRQGQARVGAVREARARRRRRLGDGLGGPQPLPGAPAMTASPPCSAAGRGRATGRRARARGRGRGGWPARPRRRQASGCRCGRADRRRRAARGGRGRRRGGCRDPCRGGPCRARSISVSKAATSPSSRACRAISRGAVNRRRARNPRRDTPRAWRSSVWITAALPPPLAVQERARREPRHLRCDLHEGGEVEVEAALDVAHQGGAARRAAAQRGEGLVEAALGERARDRPGERRRRPGERLAHVGARPDRQLHVAPTRGSRRR